MIFDSTDVDGYDLSDFEEAVRKAMKRGPEWTAYVVALWGKRYNSNAIKAMGKVLDYLLKEQGR